MGTLDGVPDIIQFGTVFVRLVERNLHGSRKDRLMTNARHGHAGPRGKRSTRQRRPHAEDPTMNGGLKNKPRP